MIKQGKIKMWNPERRFGFVTLAYGEGDAYLSASVWTEPAAPVEGDSVRVRIEQGSRGPRVAEVVAVGAAGPPAPQQGNQPAAAAAAAAVPNSGGQPSQRFLNPYNFAGPGLGGRGMSVSLLGAGQPPGREQARGRSGRLDCILTLESPLFIPDPRKSRRVGDHSHQGYFTFDDTPEWADDAVPGDCTADRPAIPSSSLRGMTRSIYECVTESCYAIFDGGPLDFRTAADLGFVPVRVVSAPTRTNPGCVQVLDASEGGPNSNTGRANLMRAGTVFAYPRSVKEIAKNRGYRAAGYVEGADLPSGTPVMAVVKERPTIDQKGRFAAYDVRSMAQISENAPCPVPEVPAGTVIVFGYYHRTGPNFTRKHHERLFFDWRSTPGGRTLDEAKNFFFAEHKSPSLVAALPERAADRFLASMRGYHDRHSKNAQLPSPRPVPDSAQKNIRVSDFVAKTGAAAPHKWSDVLRKDGSTLGYAWIENGVVRDLFPVTVARVAHPASRLELLPHHLRPCSSDEALCPACRLFGWVRPSGEGEERESEAGRVDSWRGRVRFSSASLVGEWDPTRAENATLAILGTPKPTATAFYLRPLKDKYEQQRTKRQPNPRELAKVAHPLYDAREARMAGRKIYRKQRWQRGQSLANTEVIRAGDGGPPPQDNQNRTVTLVREGPADNPTIFRFSVHFENLVDAELGALLWSLELGGVEGARHRLGTGRPLGLGQCTLSVEGVETIETNAWYGSFSGSEGLQVRRGDELAAWKTQSMEAFLNEWRALGVKNPHDEVGSLAELLTLLSHDFELPVHYPRLTQRAAKEGKNFDWFRQFAGRDGQRYEQEGRLKDPTVEKGVRGGLPYRR